MPVCRNATAGVSAKATLRPGEKSIAVRADLHPAGCRLLQKVDGTQQRALAAAGGADERRHTAFGDGERDVVQDGRVAEAFDDMGERDHLMDSSMPP